VTLKVSIVAFTFSSLPSGEPLNHESGLRYGLHEDSRSKVREGIRTTRCPPRAGTAASRRF
jgi:hypothetical protein